MIIHITAKFEGKELAYHADFKVSRVDGNEDKIRSHAISLLKKKCAEKFEIDFQTLQEIEVYYFDGEDKKEQKEITIFKKSKK